MENKRQIVIQMDEAGWKEALIGFFSSHPTLAKAKALIANTCEAVDRKRFAEKYADTPPAAHIAKVMDSMSDNHDAILCINDINANELTIATCAYISTPADWYIDTIADMPEAFQTLFPYAEFAVPA